MDRNAKQNLARTKRAWRVRRKLHGTADRPRLTVFRSLKNTYAQLIDDDAGVTLASASTRDKELRGTMADGKGGDTAAAEAIGTAIAERAKAKGVTKVCFDRGPYKYHGRVKALADKAREGGLDF